MAVRLEADSPRLRGDVEPMDSGTHGRSVEIRYAHETPESFPTQWRCGGLEKRAARLACGVAGGHLPGGAASLAGQPTTAVLPTVSLSSSACWSHGGMASADKSSACWSHGGMASADKSCRNAELIAESADSDDSRAVGNC